MTQPLDVLVIESHQGAAESAVHALEEAGHHVHRCYDDSRDFPCRGVIDPDGCALARHTDVAICAIGAGAPLVETGPGGLDPHGAWTAVRAGDDVVATCEAPSEATLDMLRREILRLAAPVLFGAGILTEQTWCRLEPMATRLRVDFDLPITVAPAVKQALGVRVLDAVRGADRTYGPVQVTVHGPA